MEGKHSHTALELGNILLELMTPQVQDVSDVNNELIGFQLLSILHSKLRLLFGTNIVQLNIQVP